MKYVAGAQKNNTKKSLGQHWLHDSDSLTSIADSADVQPGDYILEVGPGLGTLTDVLKDRGADVLALEFDRDLISKLQSKFSNCDKVAIAQGDIRTFDFGSLPQNYKVVANIPYYLTSNLIRSLAEADNQPQVASMLIQKEVAERICAGPGQMGILSVVAQFYFECRLGVEVPAALFTPPPKVDSQVVVLEKRTDKLFAGIDEQKLFTLVKAGFSEKRKTLRNSLSGGLSLSKEDVELLLQHAGLKATARAQELSLKEWHKLYLKYESR
jgi:16S rRNA (adenine1518-N6/adenine1519-N6)-dimethyltransferase